MTITGVGNDQSLHCHCIFFHEVRNTRIGINYQLICKPHLATLIAFFNTDKMFAKRPVAITNGHAYGCIGIHHLFSTDHFDLIGIGIQFEIFRQTRNFPIKCLYQLEGPFRTCRYRLFFHTVFLLNRARNTG